MEHDMTGNENFLDRIQQRLRQHQEEIGKKSLHIEQQMKQLLQARTTFLEKARAVVQTIIQPKMKSLASQFDNAILGDPERNSEFNCIIRFSPTARFPARGNLELTVSSENEYRNIVLQYKLELLPILMEYKRHDEMRFDVEQPNKAITEWVESRIFDFLDTYLLLETHPRYQQENYVSDPVCGMRITKAEAATTLSDGTITVYFCSRQCKETYLRDTKPRVA